MLLGFAHLQWIGWIKFHSSFNMFLHPAVCQPTPDSFVESECRPLKIRWGTLLDAASVEIGQTDPSSVLLKTASWSWCLKSACDFMAMLCLCQFNCQFEMLSFVGVANAFTQTVR